MREWRCIERNLEALEKAAKRPPFLLPDEGYFGVPLAWLACPVPVEDDMAVPLLRPKLGLAAAPKPSDVQPANDDCGTTNTWPPEEL